ncbi:hypothetical protein BC830DRAFT_1113192, partial [Chytriomyces sp. MP71]
MSSIHIPQRKPKAGCPACMALQGITPVGGSAISGGPSPNGNKLHPREWQTVGVAERKSNLPGFAFTPFEHFCSIHATPMTSSEIRDVSGKGLSSKDPFVVPTPPPARKTATGLGLRRTASVSMSSIGSTDSKGSRVSLSSSSTTDSKASRHRSLMPRPVSHKDNYDLRSEPPSPLPPSPPTTPSRLRMSLPVPARNSHSAIASVTASSPSSITYGPKQQTRTALPIPQRLVSKSASSPVLKETAPELQDTASVDVSMIGGSVTIQSKEGSHTVEKHSDFAAEPIVASTDDSVTSLTPPADVADVREVSTTSVPASSASVVQGVEEETSTGSSRVGVMVTTTVTTTTTTTVTDASSALSMAVVDFLPSDSQEMSQLDKYIASTSIRTPYDDEDMSSLISYDFHGSDGMTTIAPSVAPTEGGYGNSLLQLNLPSKRRGRKPIDMTNLTLLHHLLTTRLADMQTHHAALLQTKRSSFTVCPGDGTSPALLLRSHHKASYLNSAREIVFLGKGIAKSWEPIARGCTDKYLAQDLLLSLQKVDTLSARMKGIIGIQVRGLGGSGDDVDVEGTVLSSAFEVVKAAEGALKDLEAVSVKVFEKEEAGEENDLTTTYVERRKSYAESAFGIEGTNVEFSGMEGMQEALAIAMRAAGRVG